MHLFRRLSHEEAKTAHDKTVEDIERLNVMVIAPGPITQLALFGREWRLGRMVNELARTEAETTQYIPISELPAEAISPMPLDPQQLVEAIRLAKEDQ